MIREFRADCQRMINQHQIGSPLRLLQIFLFNHGLQALLVYRLGRELIAIGRRRPLLWPLLLLGWPVYLILSIYIRLAYDINLELSADIGPGLYIGHFGDISIKHCKIGSLCNIAQFTHIGNDNTGRGPIIGDRVWIGALAKINGPYRIGDRATVSAAAVVLRDIKEDAMCLGNPARVVMSVYDNSVILGLPPITTNENLSE